MNVQTQGKKCIEIHVNGETVSALCEICEEQSGTHALFELWLCDTCDPATDIDIDKRLPVVSPTGNGVRLVGWLCDDDYAQTCDDASRRY